METAESVFYFSEDFSALVVMKDFTYLAPSPIAWLVHGVNTLYAHDQICVLAQGEENLDLIIVIVIDRHATNFRSTLITDVTD